MLAIRFGLHGDHFALCFLPAFFIGDQELLTEDDRGSQNHHPAMAADGMRARLDFELLILFIKALDDQIHKKCYSGSTAPFNAATRLPVLHPILHLRLHLLHLRLLVGHLAHCGVATDVLLTYPRMHVYGLNMSGEFNPFKRISEAIHGVGYRIS